MHLGELVERAARNYGERCAVVDGDRRASFREVNERANRFGNAMVARGLVPGDRVALLLGNRLEWFDTTYGLLKAGLVRTYVNPRAAGPEIEYQLSDADVSVVVVSDEYAPLLDSVTLPEGVEVIATGPEYEAMLAAADPAPPVAQLDESTVAAIMYSSGTTGRPKGALQTHGNWLASTTHTLLEVGITPDDVLIHVGPMSHASGGFSYSFLYRGGRQVLHRGFDPEEMLDALEEQQVTFLLLVPTMIYFLVDMLKIHPVDLSRIRTILYGGSPIAPERLAECLEVIGPVFVQSYGLTEAVGGDTHLLKEDHVVGSLLLASAGRPSLHVEVRIVDDDGADLPTGEPGEVWMRGPMVMAGYWRRPEETAAAIDADGWLHTGDVAYLDDAGYLFIVDRKADMIVSGGFNVYPREVEDALMAHEAVAEAIVVGIPDERYGEAVHAAVRLHEPDADTDAATEEALVAWTRERLGGVKVPRSFAFVAEPLPRKANGKPLRRVVREPHWAGHDRRVG